MGLFSSKEDNSSLVPTARDVVRGIAKEEAEDIKKDIEDAKKDIEMKAVQKELAELKMHKIAQDAVEKDNMYEEIADLKRKSPKPTI
ncbi:hypothetical protein J2127_000512 [Methanococcus voltae]|uniref:Uncharacterized protein n=1 Tax=Methanococcus voltae TaxID=2188 RepID=A0A8J7URU3_METVO|nr:hypothetical protein [Methanococcus voltae]MBP2143357.1 hypothetical protein [Methanococcus voltae]MBP2202138.1 hypothetical protein [Methanococcus voltae]